jgi:branched-chain amino acid transport system substrate-binding protein
MRKLYRVAAASTAVAAVALAGCGGSGSSSAAGSSGSGSSGSASTGSSGAINVLAVVDKSGPTKAYGTQELLGIKAAAKYYNSKGGINGRKISVTSINGNGDPSTATSRVVKALSSHPHKYAMVYPGAEGTVATALAPIMKRYKQYSIAIDDGQAGCASASKCPTEFSLVGSAAIPEVRAAQWMKHKGYTNVGILEEKVDFTQSETKPMQKSLSKQGIKHETVGFPESTVNISSEMAKLKTAGAQAVFAEVVGAPAGYTFKARHQLSWNAPVVFDIAGASLDISKLASAAEVKNSYQTVPYCSDMSNKIPAFKQLYKFAPNLNGSIPCNLSGNGWDSIVLLKDAVEQAQSTDSAALVKATENLSSKAVSDPNYIVYPKRKYTAKNHEDVAQTPSDFSILPTGTVKKTRLHSIS